MNAYEQFQADHLGQALAAAREEVRQNPKDLGARNFLAELQCFAGDWEGADRQLDALAQLDPATMPGVGLFRQLVRADQARHQSYAGNGVPAFLGSPSPSFQLHLRAAVELREGRPAEAHKLLGEAEAQRPKVRGTCDGRPFEGLRDLDDVLAPFLEVLTAKGTFYWVPFERVERLEFEPPKRPRDLLWRRAQIAVRDGPEGEVYLPVLYVGSHAEADDRVKLGRLTDWRGGHGAPFRGVGQRLLLVGGEERPVLEIREVTTAAPG
jgi:type VI secretion system protein ImpE